MSYESATATKLLATHCAVCCRPLVDAQSVELGIGPDCRRKYGFGSASAPGREEANKIVYAIAELVSTGQNVGSAAAPGVTRLRELGFNTLADKLMDKWCPIRIEEQNGMLYVKTPYDPEAVNSCRSIRGRRWDHAKKQNSFPTTSRGQVWEWLKRHYAGSAGIGPKGMLFVVEDAVTP
jgi:hypothetical protein